MDVTIYIYNTLKRLISKEQDEIRLFYKNIMIFNLMDYKDWNKGPILSLSASLLEDDLEEKDPINNNNRSFDSLKEDIFKHRIPENRGLEWVIKSYPHIIRSFDNSSQLFINYSPHMNTMNQIKIFGEKNYLCQQVYEFTEGYIPYGATSKSKILYLNNEPIEEILIDYENYLQGLQFRLYIDEYGQP